MKLFAGTLVLFAGLSVVAAGQTPTPPRNPQPALPQVPADPMTASVDDISNDAAKYYGKTVRVVEDVARVLAPRIFTLDEEHPIKPGQDVMVVSPKGVTVREDEDVEVVGVVREFTWTELEKETFDFDLKREWQMEFKSRPVIYATSVKPKATF
ncbi:MAG: hypothetical protein AB7H93_05915 [Vicinamibacterales bacterium]